MNYKDIDANLINQNQKMFCKTSNDRIGMKY